MAAGFLSCLTSLPVLSRSLRPVSLATARQLVMSRLVRRHRVELGAVQAREAAQPRAGAMSPRLVRRSHLAACSRARNVRASVAQVSNSLLHVPVRGNLFITPLEAAKPTSVGNTNAPSPSRSEHTSRFLPLLPAFRGLRPDHTLPWRVRVRPGRSAPAASSPPASIPEDRPASAPRAASRAASRIARRPCCPRRSVVQQRDTILDRAPVSTIAQQREAPPVLGHDFVHEVLDVSAFPALSTSDRVPARPRVRRCPFIDAA